MNRRYVPLNDHFQIYFNNCQIYSSKASIIYFSHLLQISYAVNKHTVQHSKFNSTFSFEDEKSHDQLTKPIKNRTGKEMLSKRSW